MAIHSEIAHSLTSDSDIMALKRFTDRIVRPLYINMEMSIIDYNDLDKFITTNVIKFNFITPSDLFMVVFGKG